MTADLEQPAPPCTAAKCTRPAAPGATLCAPDLARLGDMIANLGTEYELLSAAPTMQGRDTGTIGGTTLTSQRAPGNTHVMTLRDERPAYWDGVDHWGADNTPSVYQTLHQWAEIVRDGRDLVQPVRHVQPCLFPCMHRACLTGIGHAIPVTLTVATERQVLATHLTWITAQDWAGDFHDAIRQLWALMRRANGHGTPPRRIHRLHTPCPMCGVRALTHRPGTAAVTCESCGHTQTVPQLEDTA